MAEQARAGRAARSTSSSARPATPGKTINTVGYKIYDPAYPPFSSNPKATYRYSDPTFRDTSRDLYLGEHVSTSYAEVRGWSANKNTIGVQVKATNVLDLTDQTVLKQRGIDPARLVLQKEVDPTAYAYTTRVSNDAYTQGYHGIKYPSAQQPGGTCLVLFGGRYDPSDLVTIFDVANGSVGH
jgi:RES domain-containing protein